MWVSSLSSSFRGQGTAATDISTTAVAKAINAAVSCSDDSFGRSVPAVQMYQVPVVVVNLMSMTAVQQPNHGLVAISVRQG